MSPALLAVLGLSAVLLASRRRRASAALGLPASPPSGAPKPPSGSGSGSGSSSFAPSAGQKSLPPFFASLPSRFGAGVGDPLEDALASAILDRGEYDWHNVTLLGSVDGEPAVVTVPVSNAVKVDGVRVNVRYDYAVRLVRRLGVLLPTTLIADEVHRSATARSYPQFDKMQGYVKAGTNTSVVAMVQHSRLVDEALAGAQGLADNEGKWFVLDRLHFSAYGRTRSGIYGWWRTILGGPIQTNVLAHELMFADYSQVLRFVGPTAVVQIGDAPAFEIPTAELYTSATLGHLVVKGGPLPGSEHPNVPWGLAA